MTEAEKALACAVRALARRDHSVAEIERKLRDKKFPPAVTAEVVSRLEKSGYLDDRRFAERWAEAAVSSGRGYGVRLRVELMRRGVSREIIEAVLAMDCREPWRRRNSCRRGNEKVCGFRPANGNRAGQTTGHGISSAARLFHGGHSSDCFREEVAAVSIMNELI